MSYTALEYRRAESDAAQTEVFDIVVIGAGITGACLFHQLREKGFRVLLADKSDFAGGTSQASAMMLWGGLAYLRSFDLPTVAPGFRPLEKPWCVGCAITPRPEHSATSFHRQDRKSRQSSNPPSTSIGCWADSDGLGPGLSKTSENCPFSRRSQETAMSTRRPIFPIPMHDS